MHGSTIKHRYRRFAEMTALHLYKPLRQAELRGFRVRHRNLHGAHMLHTVTAAIRSAVRPGAGVITASVFLTACGFFYWPSSEERTSREITSREVLATFRKFPHPLEAEANPPRETHGSVVLFGNYFEQSAKLRSTYVTNESAQEVCNAFLQVMENKLRLSTTSTRGACAPRRVQNHIHYSIDGRNEKLSSEKSFNVSIGIDDRSQLQGAVATTSVEIWITYVLNVTNREYCAPSASGKIRPRCRAAHWNDPSAYAHLHERRES